mmetsp:Transcript_2889/g.4920  ORF Transcript_2889/g.4920 Transcript_2889/m.4920 type:complete len:81 (+) Transcript_2889:205-447(+)
MQGVMHKMGNELFFNNTMPLPNLSQSNKNTSRSFKSTRNLHSSNIDLRNQFNTNQGLSYKQSQPEGKIEEGAQGYQGGGV